MKKHLKFIITLFTLSLLLVSCDAPPPQKVKADSGVTKTSVKIKTGSDGLTTEQRNVGRRLQEDNKIGAIKHLYVISSMSGQTILYSTVDGKVTSGGKRLTNTMRIAGRFEQRRVMPNIQDDGTYGNSMPYLYWWDIKGVYHQHYVTGGQIVHISEQAMPVTDITINLTTD